MKKTLIILSILLTPIFFLLFHDKGNEYLKPYVASYLETKLEQNMSLEVEHLKIDHDYVEFHAVLNDLTKIKAQGQVNLLAQTLKINYTLKSDGFKTFHNKVDINGTLRGDFNDLDIKGEGETLKSHINYSLNVKDELINNIKVNIKKADIASLLELAAQAPYAKGTVDIDINIPSLEDMSTKGKAKIILHETTLNEKIFKKEFKINLPKKTIITANIDSKISAEVFELEGDISSNLATVKLSQTTYNLKSKELLSNYVLSVPKLSKLMFLTKQKLNARLGVRGQLEVKKDAFNLQGKSKSLGGETEFNFNGKKLNVDMKNVAIARLLHFLGEKPYARGKLMANVKLSDIKDLTGTFKVKTQDAKSIHPTLKKELNVDLGKAINFSLNSEGNIASNILSVQSSLKSDLFNYRSDDMQYQLKDATLKSTYLLDIPKLSKLNTLSRKVLKGQLVINGKMDYYNTLKITGLTKSLGGDINFKLLDKKITAHINKVPVEKLMYLLSYPQLFKATLMGDLNYNLKTRQGAFRSQLNKAQLLSNQLTVLIKQIRGLDLTKERYNETRFNAILDKDIININFKAKSKKVLLQIPSGQINKISNTINAKYHINIDNNNIAGRIKGNIANPKITINASSFMKDQVMDVMNGNISEETLKDLGLGNIKPDVIKNTVENLLGDLFK